MPSTRNNYVKATPGNAATGSISLSLVFHGLFGFLLDQKQVVISAPLIHDHVYAARITTTSQDSQGKPIPTPLTLPVLLPPTVGVTFGINTITPQPPDNTQVLQVVNGPYVLSESPQPPPYFSLTVSYPDRWEFPREVMNVLCGFGGIDAPPDATSTSTAKNYPVVHRLVYLSIGPSSLQVSVTYTPVKGSSEQVTFNLANNLPPADNLSVHFYAESLDSDMHEPSEALDSLRSLYTPQPQIFMDPTLQAVAEPASTSEEQDIGEYLGSSNMVKRPRNTIAGKLRNCIAVFLPGSN